MRSLKLLVLVACVALSGCWSSNGLLFSRSDGVSPIANGVYTRSDGSRATVQAQGGGWYEVDDQDGPMNIFMVTLGDGFYGVAEGIPDCVSSCSYDYAVLRVSGRNAYQYEADDSVRIALDHGASCTQDGDCTFYSEPGLRGALWDVARSGRIVETYTLQ